MIGLNVEPGHQTCRKRLYIGFLSSSLSAVHFSFDIPIIKSLLSYDGVLLNANTSPVYWFIATVQLLSSLNCSYNSFCKSESIVSFISFPFSTIVLTTIFFLLPFESTIEIAHPFCPFNSFSNNPSIPLFPITLFDVYPSPACSSKSSAVTF